MIYPKAVRGWPLIAAVAGHKMVASFMFIENRESSGEPLPFVRVPRTTKLRRCMEAPQD
jgi:hypothetical protein